MIGDIAASTLRTLGLGFFLALFLGISFPIGDAHGEEPAANAQAEEPMVPAIEPDSAGPAPMDEPEPANGEAEPQLQFNFRFQQWEDVLEWFAEQAGLSLVLDAPPPGTFNYTDTQQYTPVEALDLLNGVLQTNGYTLIRRDRMLRVVNLEEGIPEGLVPQVDAEELDERGNFELVRVRFSLGRRDAEGVNDEIAPLLGPHGKSVPLPQTRQILVTDTAGKVQAISEVIESIPEPRESTEEQEELERRRRELDRRQRQLDQRERELEERPELVVYPLQASDPETVVEVLSSLISRGTFAADLKASQVNVYARPTEQTAVHGVIKQMEASYAPENRPRLEVYPVRTENTARLLANLELVAPEMRLSIDDRTGELVAWGSPEDHEAIQTAIEKLRHDRSDDDTRQLEVYRVTKADPETVLSLLENLVPAARLSIDSQTNNLIAVAEAADHQLIRNMLEQLQPQEPDPNAPQLRFYPLEKPLPADAVTVLGEIAPEAQFHGDDDQRLTVIATPADHERIQSTLEQLNETLPAAEQNQLQVYAVTPAQRNRFEAVQESISDELPGIRVVTDAEPGELAVWAQPSQHEVLAGILEQLKQDVPPEDKYRLVTYQLQAADPESVRSVMEEMFPGLNLILDSETHRIHVWAAPGQDEAVQAALEQLDAEKPVGRREMFRVYPIRGADPEAALLLFEELFPDVTFISDASASSIGAWGRQADHEEIALLVEQVKGEGELSAVVYSLESIDTPQAMETLQAIVPEARLTAGPNSHQLLAWARPEDHETLDNLIQTLEAEGAAAGQLVLAVYPLEDMDAETVTEVLESSFEDNAQFIRDESRKNLIVRATASQQAKIREALEDLAGQLPSVGTDLKAAVYTLEAIDVSDRWTMRTLRDIVPGAELIAGSEPNQLLVWARPEDHEILDAMIQQLEAQGTADGDQVLAVYPLNDVDVDMVTELLEPSLTESAQLLPDERRNSLVVRATVEQHEKVRAALDQLAVELPASSATAVVYTLEAIDVSDRWTMRTLRDIVPEAELIAGSEPNQLLVWARPKDHEILDAMIQQLEAHGAADGNQVLTVYPLNGVDASMVTELLESSLENNAQIIADEGRDSLIVRASASYQEQVEEALDQLARELPGADARLEVFQLHVVDPLSAELAIGRMFDDQNSQNSPFVNSDAFSRQLLVRAGEKQLDEIRDLLVKMGETRLAAARYEEGGTIRVIPFDGNTYSAVNEIQRVWSRLRQNEIRIMSPSGSAGFQSGPSRSPRGLRFLDGSPASAPSSSQQAPAPTAPAAGEGDTTWLRPPSANFVSIEESVNSESEAAESKADDFQTAESEPVESEAAERQRPESAEVEGEPQPGQSEAAEPDAAESNPFQPEPAVPDAAAGQAGESERAASETPRSEQQEVAPLVEDPAALLEEADEAPAPQPQSPIVVVPGDDSITISSDDPEALEQFESLLRAMSPPVAPARQKAEFAVYALRHATASQVASTMEQLLEEMPLGWQGGLNGSVVVAPDERLNAVVVHANPADLDTVENLLNVLDSEEIPEFQAASRPHRIPVENMLAAEMEQVLRGIYESELRSGGGRPPLPVPAGANPRVARTIQQMNEASDAPLLTISLEEITNSLVVMAPATLVEEIEDLVRELDRSADEQSAGSTAIIQLQRLNAQGLEEALEPFNSNQRRPQRRGGRR